MSSGLVLDCPRNRARRFEFRGAAIPDVWHQRQRNLRSSVTRLCKSSCWARKSCAAMASSIIFRLLQDNELASVLGGQLTINETAWQQVVRLASAAASLSTHASSVPAVATRPLITQSADTARPARWKRAYTGGVFVYAKKKAAATGSRCARRCRLLTAITAPQRICTVTSFEPMSATQKTVTSPRPRNERGNSTLI